MTVMDAVEWYVSFWKGVFEMRVGTFVFALGLLGFMLFVVPSLSRAEEPAQAPPIDPRFSVRLESAEARIAEAEAKIEDLTKQLAEVKQASACECMKPVEKTTTPPVALPLEKPTTATTRTVCGPNGCYEVESNPFAAPRAYQGGGSCAGGSCGVKTKRGFFGRVFGRRGR